MYKSDIQFIREKYRELAEENNRIREDKRKLEEEVIRLRKLVATLTDLDNETN